MVIGRFVAWFTDPDRKEWGWEDRVGRLVYGKRWDYPLGKSWEERHSDGVVADDWRGIAEELYQALRTWGISGAPEREAALVRYQEAAHIDGVVTDE